MLIARLSIYNANIAALNNLTDEQFDGVYMTISQVVDYFNFKHFPKFKILKTKEYIKQLPFCIYYRKHSCLLEAFDRQIRAYTSGGLINYWADSFLKLHHLQNNNDGSEMEAKALKLNQFSGIVTICGCLIIVSVILFIFEFLSESNALVKTILDFLTYDDIQKVDARFRR